jgi:transcriptional regulator with XRE-family HTH domain
MAKRRRYASETFGPAVERLMNESGITYRALAAKTGLSAGYLNHLVHGNRPVPSNDVVETLAAGWTWSRSTFGVPARVITESSKRCPISWIAFISV